MPKPVKIVIPNFSGGEQSLGLSPQIEIEKQRVGVKTCLNNTITPLGEVESTPGTEYIADARTATVLSRLVPFVFNKEQAYILEFSNERMRVIKDGALVVSGGSPLEVTTPWPTADLPDVDFRARSADTLYALHSDYPMRKITRTAHDAWTVTKINEIDGPYKPRVEGDSDITLQVRYSGSGSSWTIEASSAIFGDVDGTEVIRLGFLKPDGDLYWNFFQVSSVVSTSILTVDDLGGDIGFQHVLNWDMANGIEFWEDRSDANSTLTWDFTNQRAVLTDGATGFARMMQSILVKNRQTYQLIVDFHDIDGTSVIRVGTSALDDSIYNSGSLGPGAVNHVAEILTTAEVIYITINTNGSTDTDVSEINYVSLKEYEAGASNPKYFTNEWRLAAWNETHGFPTKGIISNGRFIAANNDAEPQTIWVSEFGEFEKFGFNTPLRATDSYSFSADTEERNGIEWMAEYNGLKIGTADAVWSVFSSSGGVISALDTNIQIDSNTGTLPLQPVVAGNSLIITPRGDAGVMELTSSFEASGFVPRDLSILARHLFKNRRIIKWAYAKEPNSVIWCVLDNGTLLGLTYKKEYDIWAWHRRTTPKGEGFKDVAVIPNSSDDNIDDVYFVINRAEVGETANYTLEKFSTRITPQEAAYGLSASGSPHDYKALDYAVSLGFATSYINAATQANPVVVTTTAAHGLTDGSLILINDVKGMTELNGNEYRVANKTATTFELTDKATGANINGTGFTAYTSDGTVQEQVPTITGATQADPVVITANSHNFSDGDLVRIQNVIGMTELNDNVYKVASGTATTFEITDENDVDIDGTGFTAYLTGGEVRPMVTAISGLDHLDGETVTVLADGRIETDHIPSSGLITLDNAASFAHIGLPITPTLETHPLDTFFSNGVSQGDVKTIKRIFAYFKETLGGKAGPDEDYLKAFIFWQESDAGNVPELFTGWKELYLDGVSSLNESVLIQQDEPRPMTLVRLVAEVETGDS